MISKINDLLQSLVSIIMSILPNSPVQPFIDSIQSVSWLGWLNWVVPVGTFVTIGAAWLAAIVVFYTYQLILRWSKAVGD